MQWVFLVLGLVAALAELQSGTFYLAGVAVASFLTALGGFWVGPDWHPVVLLRRRLAAGGRALPDPDVGQMVTVVSVSDESGRLVVSYRGSRWEAVMDKGAVVGPGQVAVITRKTDKLLHLAGRS
jgi:membrane protein implicated in regulation of membrane protease activity